MKRFLAVFLTLAILLTGLTVTASAASPWKKDGDYWTYTKSNGKLAEDEWIQDGGTWYYFSGTYMIADSIMQINKQWYAFNKSGAMVANDWYGMEWTGERSDGKKIKGYDWFYAGADGALAKGWKKIGKAWYYFEEKDTDSYTDPETGETYTWSVSPYMYSGGISEIKGTWYAFKYSGEMIVGWGQPWIDSPWNIEPDTDWVYANADGSLTPGWKSLGGKWYYFWPDWPYMARDTVLPIKNGKIDYESEKPQALYAFNESGDMVEKGWYQSHYYNEDGKKVPGAWYLVANGSVVRGWAQDGGKWYYLDEYWGGMYSDCMVTMSDNKTYAFEKSGAMVIGWYKSEGGDWYYFDANGARVEEEWVQDGGKWYYMKEYGVMAKDETLTIGKKDYTFGKDGAWTGK